MVGKSWGSQRIGYMDVDLERVAPQKARTAHEHGAALVREHSSKHHRA